MNGNNGDFVEEEGLRPAPVRSHHREREREASSSHHSSSKRHNHHHHGHHAEPLFDIKQHPAAMAYAAAHPNRTIPKFGPYILLQTLGEGEFGKVKLGLHSHWAEEVAVKLIRRGNLEADVRMQKIRREIAVLESLHHPNIVRLYETIETDKYIGIILDYASGGELFDHILAHRYLREKDARKLFAQLISAVWYIHQKKIVHRDLKLENLLLDRNRNIIVTDFGFANRFEHRSDDLMQTSCGSPCYAAPELVVSEGMYVGSAVDIWSCGVILYAMLAGYLPFDDDPENPEGDNIQQLYRYILNTPLTFPEHVSHEARDLLQIMLVPDPAQRATLSSVMAHSWLEPYHHLFERSVEDVEKESRELIEAKKWGYRKLMREREKEALRAQKLAQQERAMKHQTHQIEPSSSSRDARSQFDHSQGQNERNRRAIASAIVLTSSAQEEESLPEPAPFIPTPATTSADPTHRDRTTSTRSHSSKKGRPPTADNVSPANVSGNDNAIPTPAPQKKKGGFRHTIQLEYDDGTEIPNPPTPPRPSSRSQRSQQAQLELDVSHLDLNGRAEAERQSPVQQSPSRQRRRSSASRPPVSIPAVPAIPTNLTPVGTVAGVTPGRRGSTSAGTSPVVMRNAATDPGSANREQNCETSESSAAVTPLSSPPMEQPFIVDSTVPGIQQQPAIVQSPIEMKNESQVLGKKESQDGASKRPASAGGRRHTRGISIDRIVGFGKMITGQGKESKDPINAATVQDQPTGTTTTPKKVKRSSSRMGRKGTEPSVPTDETKSEVTEGSSTTVGPPPVPAIPPSASASGTPSSVSSATMSSASPGQDISLSESTSGSVKSKRRGGKALSLMVDPISKVMEHRTKNRGSVQVGGTRALEEEYVEKNKETKKDRKAKGVSTPLGTHSEKEPAPFSSVGSISTQQMVHHEKTTSTNAGWRLPIFKDSSQKGLPRIPQAQQPPSSTLPPAPETFGPASGAGVGAPRIVMSAATTKSQGVMDWFRKKSLARERRRAESSAEPPTMPMPRAAIDENFVEGLEKERAKTPTQMDTEQAARTPTRATFHTKAATSAGGRNDGTMPSVVVTTAAGEAASSGNSHHGSVGTTSTNVTPSKMGRVVGAIKNVTSPPTNVPVPINKSGKGASSGGSVGGSSSGGQSYNKVVLRVHDGPVDPSTLSSAPPQEIIVKVLEVLNDLGIEYTKESEFKYRCVRPKKRKAGLREPSGSGTMGHAANGLDKRGLPVPSSSSFASAPGNMLKYIMRRSSSQAPPPPNFGANTPVAFDEDAIDLGTPAHDLPSSENPNQGSPKVEPIYGDKPDQHDEVRFSIEVTKLDRLEDLLSLDIRRLKGNLKSYKFLYDIIRERCNLQR